MTVLLAVALVVVWIGGGGISAVSFTAGDVQRSAAADVTSDPLGAHAIDAASAVSVNATDPLANVTNRLGRGVTVTVRLRDDSTHVGDLVVDGTTVGNEATFALAQGATETVSIAVPDDSSLATESVYFHVNATASGIDVSAPGRRVEVNE